MEHNIYTPFGSAIFQPPGAKSHPTGGKGDMKSGSMNSGSMTYGK